MRDVERWKSGKPIEEKIIGPYVIKHHIGEGGTGNVKLAYNLETGLHAAVKIVTKTVTRKRRDACKEVRILQNVVHPNVIRLEHVGEDLEDMYLFMEFHDQGDIYSFVSKNRVFDEYSARMLALQMVEAVDFCHKGLRICHHDVKLENFVLTTDLRVRIIDFGFAIDIDPAAANQRSITVFDSSPAYSALEVLVRRPHDYTVDIFGLGVCFFFMVCGFFPFCDPDNTTYEELVHNVQAGLIEFPPGISYEFQHLIRGMLARKNRMTTDEIRAHNWFSVTY